MNWSACGTRAGFQRRRCGFGHLLACSSAPSLKGRATPARATGLGVAQRPAKTASGLLLPLLPNGWRYAERYRETRCLWMAAGVTSCKWEGPVLSVVIIFTISSALFVFYVVEVLRHVFCTSPDGQEPTPTAQTSSENDLSHRGPRGTGPMGYSGKIGIVFS